MNTISSPIAVASDLEEPILEQPVCFVKNCLNYATVACHVLGCDNNMCQKHMTFNKNNIPMCQQCLSKNNRRYSIWVMVLAIIFLFSALIVYLSKKSKVLGPALLAFIGFIIAMIGIIMYYRHSKKFHTSKYERVQN
jgi:hypothetical protein